MIPARLRAARARAGWTIAELMVASTVVGGALFTIVFAFHVQVRETRRLYDSTVALEWVRSQLEGIRGMRHAEVQALDGTAGPFPLLSAKNLPDARGTVGVRAREDDPSALDVRVALEWGEVGGGRRRVELTAVWTPGEGAR